MCQLDVAEADAKVVGGVEAYPAVAVVNLHPGMGLARALDKAAHVAGGDAALAAQGNHQVGIVLAYATAKTIDFPCWRLYRRRQWHIVHQSIHFVANGKRLVAYAAAKLRRVVAVGPFGRLLKFERGERRGHVIYRRYAAWSAYDILRHLHYARADVGECRVVVALAAIDEAVAEGIDVAADIEARRHYEVLLVDAHVGPRHGLAAQQYVMVVDRLAERYYCLIIVKVSFHTRTSWLTYFITFDL